MTTSQQMAGQYPEPRQRNNSTSLRRALRVLQAVSVYRGQASGISLTSLAATLEMSKSTVLRLIGPLREEGLLHQDRDSGRYRLGPAAARLGAAFLRTVDLELLAGDLVRDLARRSGEAVVLVVPRGGETFGRTAGGAVLRAFGSAEAEAEVADSRRAARTTAAVRQSGWWAQVDDVAAGRGTVAAPVSDHLCRVVAAVESTFRASPHLHAVGTDGTRAEEVAAGLAVRACAATISDRLGAPRGEHELQDRTTS